MSDNSNNDSPGTAAFNTIILVGIGIAMLLVFVALSPLLPNIQKLAEQDRIEQHQVGGGQ